MDLYEGALIFLKEVPDPNRFGIVTLDPKDSQRIVKITEKPRRPDTNLAVTSLYIYDSDVFKIILKIDSC